MTKKTRARARDGKFLMREGETRIPKTVYEHSTLFPVRRDGNVPVSVYRTAEAYRGPQARRADERSVSRYVLPRDMTYAQAERWFEHPGRYDIPGVDCPRDTPPTVRFATRSEIARESRDRRVRSANRSPGTIRLLTMDGEVAIETASFQELADFVTGVLWEIVGEARQTGRPVHIPYMVRAED